MSATTKTNASRIIDGMIKRLKNGAHIRYDGIGYNLVDGDQTFLITSDQFNDLQYRYQITHTFDHTLYPGGCIWTYCGNGDDPTVVQHLHTIETHAS